MNSIIARYKKTALLVTVVTAMSMSSVLFAECNVCDSKVSENSLNCKLQALFNCCMNTKEEVRSEGHEARKCCKRLRHDIHEVEEQVEDSSSVLEELMISQIDQSATCCSVIETVLGDPATQIASFQDCFIDVLGYVNTNNDDVITWLKKLYVLMYQIFACRCCIT